MSCSVVLVRSRNRALELYELAGWLRRESLTNQDQLCCSTFLEQLLPECLPRFTYHVADTVKRKGSPEVLRGLTEFTPDPKITLSTKIYLDALAGEPSSVGTVFHEGLHALEHQVSAAQGRLSKRETQILEAEADFVAAAVMFPLEAISEKTTTDSLRAAHYDDRYLAEVALRHANAIHPHTWRVSK